MSNVHDLQNLNLTMASAHATEEFLVFFHCEAFHDNDPAFEDYVKGIRLEETLSEYGLEMKHQHTIVPKVK